ncbi:MAG TPA: hypothetical protein PK090_05890 [Smithellaceae bacterium]|nr:hypothetical protein [Smithellaceae bacterium]
MEPPARSDSGIFLNKKIIAGILLGLVLVYLSVRGIDLRQTLSSLADV